MPNTAVKRTRYGKARKPVGVRLRILHIERAPEIWTGG